MVESTINVKRESTFFHNSGVSKNFPIETYILSIIENLIIEKQWIVNGHKTHQWANTHMGYIDKEYHFSLLKTSMKNLACNIGNDLFSRCKACRREIWCLFNPSSVKNCSSFHMINKCLFELGIEFYLNNLVRWRSKLW